MPRLFRKIGDKLEDWGVKGKNLLIWEKGSIDDESRSLIFSIPGPEAGAEKYDIRDIKNFAVRDYERVLLLDKGSLTDVLSGGVYELDKSARVKGTRIIYIDTGNLKIPWGFPQMIGPRTKDGIQIGLSGSMMLSVTDPKAFALNLLSRHTTFTDKQLRDWIKDTLHGVLKEIIQEYKIAEVGSIKRDKLNNTIEIETVKTFERFGLRLHEFNIININVPKEYEYLLEREAERTMKVARTEDMLDDMDLQKTLEKRRVEHELELESIKLQKDKILTEKRHDLDSKVQIGSQDLERTQALHDRELAKITGDTEVINARTKYKTTVLDAIAAYQKAYQSGLAGVELDGLRLNIETGAELSKKQMEILEKVLTTVSEIKRYEGLADKVDISEFAKAEAMKIAAERPQSRAEFGTHPDASHEIHVGSEEREKTLKKLRNQLQKVEEQITELDDKLLDGTISEEKHEKMLARLMKRKKEIEDEIAKLGG
ncbi:MAG: hypothetical protein GF308_05545 [Candidatus Heimdallarchaeota archaeon]|nr:hypothetical protein [Candidatus Heimdallarchaeota archaeon]